MSAIDDALDALLEHRIAYEMVQIQYDGRADLARIRAKLSKQDTKIQRVEKLQKTWRKEIDDYMTDLKAEGQDDWIAALSIITDALASALKEG